MLLEKTKILKTENGYYKAYEMRNNLKIGFPKN